MRGRTGNWFSWAAPLLGVMLLAGIGLQQLSYAEPEDAAPYHRKVAAAMQKVPEQIGPWVSSSIKVPRSAKEILKPNVIISRRYHNPRTGESVNLMFSQCKEARDMAGHYPPRCYPGNGYTKREVKDYRWTVDGLDIPVRAYRFTRSVDGQRQQMWNLNFLLLPDGEMTRLMSRVRAAAADYRSHFFGAAQIQLIFHGDTELSQRKSVFKRFVRAMKPAIETIRSGIDHDQPTQP